MGEWFSDVNVSAHDFQQSVHERVRSGQVDETKQVGLLFERSRRGEMSG